MDESRLPDTSDSDIRAMVLRDHEPEERWVLGADNRRCFVYCRTCWNNWPCPSVMAARAAKET